MRPGRRRPVPGKAAPITINQEILRAAGLVSTLKKPLKVLGNGDLSAALFVVADAFSRSAVTKIEAAGGSVQVLEVPSGPLAALGVERRSRSQPRRRPREPADDHDDDHDDHDDHDAGSRRGRRRSRSAAAGPAAKPKAIGQGQRQPRAQGEPRSDRQGRDGQGSAGKAPKAARPRRAAAKPAATKAAKARGARPSRRKPASGKAAGKGSKTDADA